MTPEARQKAITGLRADLETVQHMTACLQATSEEAGEGGIPEARTFLDRAVDSLGDVQRCLTYALRHLGKSEGAAQIAGKPS